ncbi:MAG: TIGR03960 family B12-binding radical SAM protein [Fusobacteriaceae bacterium]|nr:TIGR03960 family B12-binding radical SAM protein [Fusobacteriaceae bacterium]
MISVEKYLLTVDKPAQYLGNEFNSVHKDDYKIDMCLIFPDVYEIGMSAVGLRILYFLLNKVEGFSLERCFSPMEDMETILRENNLSLFSLESKKPLKNFKVLGFSLSYELSFTNILNILELGQIPLRAKDRGEEYPLVMAGGTCVFNPKPLEAFFDYFVIGDGEGVMEEIAKIFVANSEKSKREKLELIKDLDGVYIPVLHKDKTIRRSIITDLNAYDYAGEQIVPYTDIVHDRAVVEIQRGCTRGCRFCQAGMIYRPVRERSLEENVEIIGKALEGTGYNEVSLSSLSSSDYSQIGPLLERLQEKYGKDKLSIQLPSLRMNNHSVNIARSIEGGRKTSFTFAPEAGSQRMRDIINKGVTEKEIINTAISAVEAGWHSLKFYFMIGLPFETMEDVKGIHELVSKVLEETKKISGRVMIRVSISNFIPKAHTPFQWAKQMSKEEMEEKHKFLKDLFYNKKGTSAKIHHMETSYLEGILARGDEKISDLIELAFRKGAKMDSWTEYFKPQAWAEAIEELGIDTEKYLGARSLDEKLPWDFIDSGVTKEFYLSEYKKAEEQNLTENCMDSCANCGINTRLQANCKDFIKNNS